MFGKPSEEEGGEVSPAIGTPEKAEPKSAVAALAGEAASAEASKEAAVEEKAASKSSVPALAGAAALGAAAVAVPTAIFAGKDAPAAIVTPTGLSFCSPIEIHSICFELHELDCAYMHMRPTPILMSLCMPPISSGTASIGLKIFLRSPAFP